MATMAAVIYANRKRNAHLKVLEEKYVLERLIVQNDHRRVLLYSGDRRIEMKTVVLN